MKIRENPWLAQGLHFLTFHPCFSDTLSNSDVLLTKAVRIYTFVTTAFR
jgi:hypothetical protein